MRRMLGVIALLAALGSGQACLAQQDPQQLQQQQDRQRRDIEQYQPPSESPVRARSRAMADEARRRAANAKTPEAKARWLKTASSWDGLALQTDQSRLQTAR